MAEDEITKEESTPSEELPEVTAPDAAPADKTEPEQVPSYQESVMALKAEYDKKFEEQRDKYEAELKERDDVIKQIMTEPSDNASAPAGDPITDRINATRHFIKW